MSYYNNDINTDPAPGTGHTLKADTFEEWKKKRDAKEAKVGWNRSSLKASVTLQELKKGKKIKR